MWTRRAFLKSGGLALFSASIGGTPFFLSRVIQAANQPGILRSRKVLVTIFQRGAMDGLMAVTPFADPYLPRLRPRLAITSTAPDDENHVLVLDGRFGLHPGFQTLWPHFREGRLAIVHGVGSPDKTRSHFDAQDYMETGTPGKKGTASGWLNRAIGLTGHDASPFRAVSLTPALPRSLYGQAPALAIANLEDFRVRVPEHSIATSQAARSFEALYELTSEQLLQRAGQESFEAIRLLSRLNVKSYRPENGARYPQTPLGRSLRQIAMLIKAEVGLEVAFAESGGWDTHVQQGTVRGTFARQAQDLAESIAAFWTDLGRHRENVVLMTMTEFGRTVRENGSGGTDHGRGSCLFVLGETVQGGRVYGEVPPLDPDALEDGRDLPVTTDFRSVFAGVAGGHLGIPQDADGQLFPGWSGQRLVLIS